MSEFVSWIEKPSKVKEQPEIFFLTAEQVFNTSKGKKLQKKLHGDFIGHSAICYYYGMREHPERGRLYEKGCTDFSSPKNFPDAIAFAIKNGEMRGFGTPQGLLMKPLYDDYDAKRKVLDDDYSAKSKVLYDDYKAKRKVLYNDYDAKRKVLYNDYDAKRKVLYDDYKAKRKVLDDDYWDLFAKSENRKEVWR